MMQNKTCKRKINEELKKYNDSYNDLINGKFNQIRTYESILKEMARCQQIIIQKLLDE